MNDSGAASASARPFLANVALLILALVAAGVAAAFFLPWLTQPDPGGPMLARYAPLAQGGARLTAEYDAAGAVTAWLSQNDTLLPPALALAAEMRKGERDALNKFFRREGETGEVPLDELMRRIAGSQVYHTRTLRLTPDGKTTESRLLAIRNERGDHLIAFYDPATDAETIFDPPIPILAADLTVGSAWEASGKRLGTQGTLDYRYSAKVIERLTHAIGTEQHADTLRVETRLAFISEGKTLYDRVSNYWLAPNLGAVASDTVEPDGKLESRAVLLSVRDRRLQDAALPAFSKRVENEPLGRDAAGWQLSRFASTRATNDNSESSIPPTWIPTNPPMLLAARYSGPLTAFDASDPSKPPLWRFQPGATIYGTPAYDPVGGRIYFGAADKRLYALDARGLFLWSFATGDNIVTRPAIVGGAVIFASEDRHIYMLDAATGAKLYVSDEVGGAIVSSPAVNGDAVLFGCDDGNIYQLDPAARELKTFYSAGAPIEAPIVVANGRVFAGTHGGNLLAIDASSGRALWSIDAGGELRTAPLIAGDTLYIVNGNARLVAYEAATGRRLWSSEEKDYVGPPVLAGESLIVGSENGDVHRVDLAGRRHGTAWRAADASTPSDGTAALRLGATEGGGAVWFADTRSVVRRLGPAAVGPVALRAAWLLPFSQEPLMSNFLTVGAVAYRNQALVVDSGREIILLDPRDGKGRRVGSFGDAASPAIEPTVSGDTLLTPAGTALYATNLLTGAPLWKFDSKETAAQPATVAGNSVFWLSQHFPPAKDGKAVAPVGMLHALDLNTGAVRWQRPLSGFTGIGAAIVSGTNVLTSAPAAAFDVATGEPRWQAQLVDAPLGGGALDASGETLFVGTINNETSRGSIAAIRTADGTVMWQQAIGDSALHPFERPWLSSDVLVVPLWSGEIIGIAADGAELWRHKSPKPRFGGISVVDGHVWFAQNDSRIIALEAKSGRVAAQLGLDLDISNMQAFAPRPLVLGNRVIMPIGMALLAAATPESKPAVTPQPQEEAQR